MSKERIQSILQELYRIDPELEQYEETVRAIIERMQDSRPDICVDSAFAQRLREELLSQAQDVPRSIPDPEVSRFPLFAAWGGLRFAVAGALLTVLAGVPLLYFSGALDVSTSPRAADKESISGGENIVRETDNRHAFGRLSDVSFAEAGGGTRYGQGGGDAPGSATVAEEVDSGDAGVQQMSPPRPAQQLVYVYTGEDTTVAADRMRVYRRDTEALRKQTADPLMKYMAPAGMDFSRLNSPSLQSFRVREEGSGISVSADFERGVISVHRNKEVPPGREQPAEGGIPSEEELIQTANTFLEKYGISHKAYGEPVVRNDVARRGNDIPEGSTAPLRGSMARVVYPQYIEGKEVRSLRGEPVGLTVSINARAGEIIGVQNIAPQAYSASFYAVAKSVSETISSYNAAYGGTGSSQELREVQLGTPSIVLTPVTRFTDQYPETYFVPAFSFPITEEPKGLSSSRETVVIPLVEEVRMPRLGAPIRITNRGQ